MLKNLLFVLFFSFLVAGCGSSSSSTEKQLHVATQITQSEPIATTQNIVLTFSSPIDFNTISSSSVYIVKDSVGSSVNELVGCSFSFDETQKKRLVLTPYKYFDQQSNYTLIVTTEVEGLDGSSLSETFYLNFSTLAHGMNDVKTPYIIATVPKDKKTDVYVESDIFIDFNEFISSSAQYLEADYFTVTDGEGNELLGEIEVFNSLMRFKPANPLPYDSNISVVFHGLVEDMYGNGDILTKSFSFVTKNADESASATSGYKSLAQTSLGTPATTISTLTSENTSATVVAGTKKGIEMYVIDFDTSSGYPEFLHKASFSLPSSVLVIQTFFEKYLLAGTAEDGVYLLELNATAKTITQKEHFLTTSGVYGISFGAPEYSSDDRVYVVSPEFGLKIFDLNATTETITIGEAIIPSDLFHTALDVVDVTAYDNVQQTSNRRIYVADYNGSIVVLDHNGSYISRTDINGSVKKLTVEEEYSTKTRLLAVCSSGKVQGVEFNGTLSQSAEMGLLGNVYDITQRTDEYSMEAKTYYSLGSKGVQITSGTYPMYHINTDKKVVATDLVYYNRDYNTMKFLVIANGDGTLEVFNAISDQTDPSLYTYPYDGSTDVSVDTFIGISISDDYLNYATVKKENFSIIDESTSSPISFTLEEGSEYSFALVPDANLSEGHTYKVKVSAQISDLLGNKLAGGVDHNISFTTQQGS